jgi:hypothetical protein
MRQLTISDSKDHFICDCEKFFYFADTAWSAFTNATLEEWEEYLDYRRMQGFNVVQIDILPQWDRSTPDLGISPFESDSSGKWNWGKPSAEYFDRARQMLDMAVDRDFTPALVVLWCNYVPDTWVTWLIGEDQVMPLEKVKQYSEFVVETFSQYKPIYFISGDTNFESDRTNEHYLTALDTIKNLSPEALTTMHIWGGGDLHDDFVNSPNLDFHIYQSGHDKDQQDFSYKVAENFYAKSVKRPIINSEPCYEGWGFTPEYGRFSSFDVRKSVCQSLLSGAKAGITYGAHGIWSWQKGGAEYKWASQLSKPFDWNQALRFRGAWDISFIKNIFEQYDLFDIEPKKAILNLTNEIRMSASEDLTKVVIYAPYNADIEVDMDLRGYEWAQFVLSERQFTVPVISISGDTSIIRMHEDISDVLLVGTRK